MSIFRSRCRNNIGKGAKLYALPTCPQLQFELNELTARHDCDLVDAKHFHHLVSEMIDDFYGDAVAGRRWERTRDRTVQRGPGVGVDFRLQRRLQRAIRIVLTRK